MLVWWCVIIPVNKFDFSVCFSSGVFDKTFVDPIVWLTALLAAWTAVLPSLTARTLNVILKAHDKHKVRHMYEKM